ncbi:unnamed protein product [Cyprideis torosa]|uniref:Peptidase aspartic putative domain-containing protein n=1 Tax=Cyprideis torosa TaxID=163714 RepID=A0A7R8W3R0_9CRUS|nr:unnamed protein product [Cyprideis torosa]CAG0883140.1 unnamed protein product [Cyprideis torosa]
MNLNQVFENFLIQDHLDMVVCVGSHPISRTSSEKILLQGADRAAYLLGLEPSGCFAMSTDHVTAKAVAEGPSKSKEIRMLIDSGSESTFIKDSVARELGLPIIKQEKLIINVFGGDRKSESVNVYRVHLRSLSSPYHTVELMALGTKQISSKVPKSLTMDAAIQYQHLRNLHFADVNVRCDEEKAISLLVGVDQFDKSELVGVDQFDKVFTSRGQRIGFPGEPIATNTVFGWVLTGSAISQRTESPELIVKHVVCEESEAGTWDLDSACKEFLKVESYGVTEDNQASLKDDEAVQMFHQSVEHNAYRRLKSLLKRLSQDEELNRMYRDAMKTMELMNFIEDIPFLWVTDQNEVRIMRFKVITFGISSAPFLLNMTILFHLSNQDSSPLMSEMKRNFYVDNLSLGSEQGVDLVNKSVEAFRVMKLAGMTLSQWASNSSFVLNQLEEKGLIVDRDPLQKLLGLQWNTKDDTKVDENAGKEPTEQHIFWVWNRRVVLRCLLTTWWYHPRACVQVPSQMIGTAASHLPSEYKRHGFENQSFQASGTFMYPQKAPRYSRRYEAALNLSSDVVYHQLPPSHNKWNGEDDEEGSGKQTVFVSMFRLSSNCSIAAGSSENLQIAAVDTAFRRDEMLKTIPDFKVEHGINEQAKTLLDSAPSPVGANPVLLLNRGNRAIPHLPTLPEVDGSSSLGLDDMTPKQQELEEEDKSNFSSSDLECGAAGVVTKSQNGSAEIETAGTHDDDTETGSVLASSATADRHSASLADDEFLKLCQHMQQQHLEEITPPNAIDVAVSHRAVPVPQPRPVPTVLTPNWDLLLNPNHTDGK